MMACLRPHTEDKTDTLISFNSLKKRGNHIIVFERREFFDVEELKLAAIYTYPHDVFKKHLYIQEDYNIDGPVCAVIGSFLVDEPDIVGLVGPSGSIKTELLRSFGETKNQFCYLISSVTEHTFVSGLKENVDTIPLLRYRPVIIKDLTTLLSKKEDIRSAVFADFRELTDGYLQKEFGNDVKKECFNIHSSVIFGCTSAIERYYSIYSNLGARMVFLKPQNDPKKARARAEQINAT